MSKNVILLFLFLIFNTFVGISGDYYVSNCDETSYLYRKYDKVNEDMFPRDRSVNVSRSTISTSLFYTIDKHTNLMERYINAIGRHINQLIVSFNGDNVQSLRLEFNKEKFSFSLSTLCKCVKCKYEIVHIRIQIKESNYIQCNNVTIATIKYTSNKQINQAYPIPIDYGEQNNNKSLNNAHLWIVNHPQYGEMYPNHKQPSGCIRNVLCNNVRFTYGETYDNIVRKCTVMCTENICNGGECMETCDAVPICNCTTTFLNGDYCNDTIRSMNNRSNIQPFIFAELKLSWQSNATELAKLRSRDTIVGVYVREKNLIVEFQYLRNGVILSTQNILFDNYKINTKSILIIKIQKMNIMAQLFNNESSQSINIAAMEDLIRVQFDIIELRSDEGIIDLSYKRDSKDLKWKKINYDKQEQLTNDLTADRKIWTIREILIPLLASIFILTLMVTLVWIMVKRKLLPMIQSVQIICKDSEDTPKQTMRGIIDATIMVYHNKCKNTTSA